MPTNISYPKGSEWRKWDLHAHTPIDNEWINKPCLDTTADKEAFAKDYIEFAKSEGLSVIAITDHNFCNNTSDSLIPYIQKEARINDITILPGFEITARNGSGIHILVIFQENSNIEVIKSIVDQLFNPGADKITSGRVLPSTKSVDEIKDIVCGSRLDCLFIFAHADSDNGVLHSQTINGEIRMDEWKKEFINICQLSKPHNEYTPGSFLDRVICGLEPNYKRGMSYIVASDCRMIDKTINVDGRKFLGEKFVWIKADPIFEGLKQIIYESESRIKIQIANPQDDFLKPYFSRIEIDNTEIFEGKNVKFAETKIELNPNLVAVIGGRGTGKSLVFDAIAKTFHNFKDIKPKDKEKKSRAENISIEDKVRVTYTKGDGTNIIFNIHDDNNIEYLHVHQGQVKEIVEDTERLDREIKKMLGIKDTSTDADNDSKIGEILYKISCAKEWLEYKDSQESRVNSKSYNDGEKKKYTELIATITTEKNKSLIDKYVANSSKYNMINDKKVNIEEVKNKIDSFVSEINTSISEINLNSDCDIRIPPVDLRLQIHSLDALLQDKYAKIQVIGSENNNIEKEFRSAGIEGDISTLLEKVKSYQVQIDSCNQKLKEIENKATELNNHIAKRNLIANSLYTKLGERMIEITSKWENLKSGAEAWSDEQKSLINDLLKDIEIITDTDFNLDKFYSLVSSVINKSKFRTTKTESSDEKIKKTFCVTDIASYFRLITNEPVIDVGNEDFLTLEEFVSYEDSNYFVKGGDKELFNFLFQSNYIVSYLEVVTRCKYLGKKPEELSVGQRGTFYICLKLATDPFSTPLIFDQPEDDLDNDFIMKKLVPIFKKIKKYRQVIIATHNANLVINADAEQVIVAHNEHEVLNYKSGSIENSFTNTSRTVSYLEKQGVREHICDILEGGKDAFKKRELKYGFKG